MSEEGSRRPSATLLYGALTLMVLFWSLNFVVARYALREFPPLLAASIRAVLAGMVLLPIYLWKGREMDPEPVKRSELPHLLLLGISGVTLNQVLFLLGYCRTSTTHAAVITGLMPLQVLAISAILGHERIHRWRAAGMLLALSGVAVLQAAKGPAVGLQPTLIGDLLVFLSGTAFAMFAVMGKSLTARHGGLTVNTFAFLGGGLCLVPVIVWQLSGFDVSRVSEVGWLSLLYMAVFPSALAYLIFYWALTHIPASRISNFTYLQPVMATLLAVLLLGDSLTGSLVAGGSLVLTGVFVSERG